MQTIRRFVNEALLSAKEQEDLDSEENRSAITAIITDVITRSDTFDLLGDDEEEQLLMVAAAIAACGVTTVFGKNVDEGEFYPLQVLGSEFFNLVNSSNPSLASHIKVLDASIGPTQIRFSHLAKPEYESARKRIGIEFPHDLNETSKAILASALFLSKNYKKAKALGYSTSSRGVNPEWSYFGPKDSTGNAALDLAFCAYNGPTEKVLVKWCYNDKKKKYEPCSSDFFSEDSKDQIPAPNFIPRFSTPGSSPDYPGTLRWISFASSFLRFILTNLKTAYYITRKIN